MAAHFTAKGLKVVLFHMHSNKSPGPNGLNPTFFKRFRHLLGPKVHKVASSWLQQSTFLLQLNSTTIVLIPKCPNRDHEKF